MRNNHFSKFNLLRRILIINALCLLHTTFISAQPPEQTERAIQSLTDQTRKVYGLNEELINGYPYAPPSTNINGHPYWSDSEWKTANLYINGDRFGQQEIKYSLIDDNVILKADFGNGTYKLIKLNKFRIDSFSVGNKTFTNSWKYFNQNHPCIFYEEIFHRDFSYIIKHKKDFVNIYNTSNPYGSYSKAKTKRLIVKNQQIFEVDRRRQFLRFYESDYRPEIRKYLRKKGINYNRATSEELKELIHFCNRLTKG